MTTTRQTLIDALCIILAGTLFGLVWNRTLLFQPQPQPTQNTPVQQGALLPVPASLQQVKELFDGKKALFVDARSDDAFRRGHIPGAVSLPAEDIANRLPPFRGEHPPGGTIVVYCNGAGCPDSMDVAEALLRERYPDVLVFEGGIPEWRGAGYPRERGAK